MNIFKNIWVKRGVSVFCGLYAAFLLWLDYMSIFYRLEYTNKAIFAVVYIGITLIFMTVMLFARKQAFTSILTMCMMVLMLPLVFLNLGNWLLIIPPAFLVLTMFFACGAGETSKTVLGTIFLLMYILGALAFFIFTNLFMTKTEDLLIENGVSSTNLYRYYVLDVMDNSTGRTEVYVEPNNMDKDFGFAVYKITGFEQRKYNVRNHEKPTIEWRDVDGKDTIFINGERCDLNEWEWKFSFTKSTIYE